MEEIILKVQNLNVKLDNEEIIKNLSFEIKEGDFVAILGPNGAGKTVLLKTLLGILPYQGEIKWQKKVKIGYVPQRLPFIKDIPISVQEFFKLKEATKAEIKEIFKAVGLEETENFFKKQLGELSSGQFQRILIGWALIKNPNVLFFDEPTSGIDIEGEEDIYRSLSQLREKKHLTILLVTHDLSIVFKYANFVIYLNRYAVCQGVPKEALTQEVLTKLYGGKIKLYPHHNS